MVTPLWRRRGLLLPLVSVLAICVLLGLEFLRHAQALDDLHGRYQEDCRRSAEATALAIDRTLGRIHEGLTTMARLPGVRSALFNRTAPQGDALVTIQELYNALAGDVAMSEVYLVTADLDPDSKDPSRNKPLVTFDELIVERPAAAKPTTSAAKDSDGPEEIEIHEYRLMRKQLDEMAARAPRPATGLRSLIVGGPPVITCDNSQFDTSRRDDLDRTGIVLSTTCYAVDGRLIGCVSGVILDHALRDLLADGHQVIDRPGPGSGIGRGDAHAPWRFREQVPQVATADVKLRFPDEAGAWTLRATYDAASRDASPAIALALRQHRMIMYLIVGATVVMTLVIHLVLQGSYRRTERRVETVLAAMAAARNGDLTVQVPVEGDDATARMGRALADFLVNLRSNLARVSVSAVQITESARALEELGGGLSADAEQSASRASAAAAGSDQVSSSAMSVSSGLEEMGASISEISSRTLQATNVARQAIGQAQRVASEAVRLNEASAQIDSVVGSIAAIAEQTNLLALNATIEAARAGDAGRGFAVVAGEVKALANQTAQATKDIGQRITSMQSASQTVTKLIGEISGTINGIEQSQAAIAAAVEEQVATTKEGARGMSEVAKASHDIAGSVAAVSGATSRTAERASSLLASAERLSEAANELALALSSYRR